MAAKDWGSIIIGTRLEKQVDSLFFQVWSGILLRGFTPGDGCLSTRGKVAHAAANDLVRRFLQTEADSLLFLDSDATVDADIIEQFRRYEPGYDYDVLQAFYCRRGWPPTPIWMERNELGAMTNVLVTQHGVADVDVCGLHCCIIRREVFETMLGDANPHEFDWFFYPRHRLASEDTAFTEEAKGLGFRLGATTEIRAGHISQLVTSWETYHDWLTKSGQMQLIERYRTLAEMISEFTGEESDLVVARSLEGQRMVSEAWKRHNPQTPDEVKAFYGEWDNGYLYDLLNWNCQPLYERVLMPLYDARDIKALIIGAGIGTEVDVLLGRGNQVDVYELPGVLQEFLVWRFDGQAKMLGRLPYGSNDYDVAVVVDVLEHVHPDEIATMLDTIDANLKANGSLVLHCEWNQCGDGYPQHFDHMAIVSEWLESYDRTGEFLWRKRETASDRQLYEP